MMIAIFQYKTLPLYKTCSGTNFVQYVIVWLVRVLTYKDANEIDYAFSWRIKKVQKRTKADKKRIPGKFTFENV